MKDSPIEDLFQKANDERGGLEKLLDKLPGFGGYLEKGRRREADRMLRSTISSRLEEVRLEISGIHQTLSRDIILAMDHAEALGEVDTRLMGLISKINDAPEGYAGWFDAVKVQEDDLARVYQFDAGMMDFVDEIAAKANVLEDAVENGGDVGAATRELNKSVQTANSAFAKRNEVILGIS
jgi:hypothetical protein